MVVFDVETPFAQTTLSVLTDNETQAILSIFSTVGASLWLEKNPFQQLNFKEKVILEGREVSGFYDYLTGSAEVSVLRSSFEYGHALEWGKIEKLSSTGKTALEAIQFTGLHELGHRVHAVLRSQDKLQFSMTIRAVKTNAVSNYAKMPLQPTEYFAETFVAWVLYRTELAVLDELGYGMIQRALKMLEFEVKEYEFSP